MAPKKARTDADADPDRLIREKAGSYRSADDRFEVHQEGIGWFVVDTAQANEFGQPLIHGPFETMAAVRAALPGARKMKPLRRGKRARPTPPKAEAPPAPPPSWIDELPPSQATEVRKVVRALEREGVSEAEDLVRRDRNGLLPAVAAQLIEQRLAALVDDLPADQREAARRLVRGAAEILTAEGTAGGAALPGWTLVEIGPDGEPPNRRIVIR
ncbi:MAG: hypothetical protein M3R05_05865 [Chloroflexota bacterium]|nr:hypothetical protein [Chloroflexota bacterium]